MPLRSRLRRKPAIIAPNATRTPAPVAAPSFVPRPEVEQPPLPPSSPLEPLVPASPGPPLVEPEEPASVVAVPPHLPFVHLPLAHCSAAVQAAPSLLLFLQTFGVPAVSQNCDAVQSAFVVQALSHLPEEQELLRH